MTNGMMRDRTYPGKARCIAFAAVMTSMSVLLSRYFSIRIPAGDVESFRFGMGGLPLIATGVALGPVYGAFSGASADLLGMALFPQGPYFPHYSPASRPNRIFLTKKPPCVIFLSEIYCFWRYFCKKLKFGGSRQKITSLRAKKTYFHSNLHLWLKRIRMTMWHLDALSNDQKFIQFSFRVFS